MTETKTKTKIGVTVGVVCLIIGLSYAFATRPNARAYSKMLVTCQDGSNAVYTNGSAVVYDANGNSTKSPLDTACAHASDWYQLAQEFCASSVHKETGEEGIDQYRVDNECESVQ